MATFAHRSSTDIWLPLPIAAWQDTYETLHLWTQIIGKIRLALAPDTVGECVTTALTNALQGVMGNERSSASAVVTFL